MSAAPAPSSVGGGSPATAAAAAPDTPGSRGSSPRVADARARPGGAAVAGPPGPSPDEIRRERRRASNRESARRIRARQGETTRSLQQRVDELQAANARLVATLDGLRAACREAVADNDVLRGQLAVALDLASRAAAGNYHAPQSAAPGGAAGPPGADGHRSASPPVLGGGGGGASGDGGGGSVPAPGLARDPGPQSPAVRHLLAALAASSGPGLAAAPAGPGALPPPAGPAAPPPPVGPPTAGPPFLAHATTSLATAASFSGLALTAPGLATSLSHHSLPLEPPPAALAALAPSASAPPLGHAQSLDAAQLATLAASCAGGYPSTASPGAAPGPPLLGRAPAADGWAQAAYAGAAGPLSQPAPLPHAGSMDAHLATLAAMLAGGGGGGGMGATAQPLPAQAAAPGVSPEALLAAAAALQQGGGRGQW